MKTESCCFTGHRDISPEKIPEIKEKLREVLIKCIEDGYRDFYNGGAVGFDIIAAETVLELKEEYPYIRLHIIVPCAGHNRRWGISDITRFERILSLSDEVKCLSPVYFNGCMQVRNRYMVNESSLCIAYLERMTGGSAGTVKYAESENLRIINIADI